MSRYINLFTDFGFKRVFGTEENKDILMDFLNEVLAFQNVHIETLTYKNSEKQGDSDAEKKVIGFIF